jgi:hypothetical protein
VGSSEKMVEEEEVREKEVDYVRAVSAEEFLGADGWETGVLIRDSGIPRCLHRRRT